MSDRQDEPKTQLPGGAIAPEGSAGQAAMSAETASLLGLIDKLGSLLERSDLVELEVEAGETGIVLRKAAALAPLAVATVAGGANAGAGGAAGLGATAGSEAGGGTRAGEAP